MRIQIVLSPFFFLILPYLELRAQQAEMKQTLVDKNIIEKFASALSNPNAMIGVFGLPQARSSPIALKSGVVPEIQRNYSDVIIKYNLLKLNLVTCIKGDFDNVIFIKRLNPRFDDPQNYVPQQIIPFSGSKWIILLNKVIGSEKDSTYNWVTDISNHHIDSFITEKTLYKFAENAYGALCLEWPKEFEQPTEVQMAGSDLVKDLQTIVSLKQTQSGQSAKNQEKAWDKLLTPYGKAIAKLVIAN